MKFVDRRQFLTSASVASSAMLLRDQRLFAQPSWAQQAPSAKFAEGTRGAAATVHPLATEAAINCLREGGNAIDAAVAASLMLSVVDSHNSGLGGGGLALIRLSSGKMIAIDGREMAPSRSTPQQYLNSDGKPDPTLSQEGPLAVAVPGLVALLERISREYGQTSWKTGLLAAAAVAENGYAISGNFAAVIKEQASRLRKYPSSAAVLLDAQGQPLAAESVLKQADLSRSLRQLAEHGSDWFYRGELAERMERFMNEQGGFLRADDMANYQTISREVITSDYRGRKIHGFPPPSSGGIHVAQMLAMLEPFDVGDIFKRSPATGYHLLLEVMKRALADRAFWLGDADFAKVPKGLLNAEYLKSRAASIDLTRATEVSSHGVPPAADIDLFGPGGHTTHLTTADSQGNVVALTQTVNTSFGSKLILPGTGIVLNNEMDDFSLAPGVRNAFGLVGSDANAIVPKKRPLSSMSPSLVTDQNGQPMFTCGAAGGPRIITTVLQAIVRAIDLQLPPDQALSQPRVHHQWSPNHAVVESSMPEAIVAELIRMGHEVLHTKHLATAQAIGLQQQKLFAASDPRVPSSARGL
jgi:gamma-glutamyltranspeptidase / glutathione hydrolase